MVIVRINLDPMRSLSDKVAQVNEQTHVTLLEVLRTIETMEVRLQTHVYECETILNSARDSLSSCLGREDAECSYEEARVREAENRLEIARQTLRDFQQAVEKYQSIEPNGRRLADQELPQIAGYLDRIFATLDRLRGLQAGLTKPD